MCRKDLLMEVKEQTDSHLASTAKMTLFSSVLNLSSVLFGVEISLS